MLDPRHEQPGGEDGRGELRQARAYRLLFSRSAREVIEINGCEYCERQHGHDEDAGVDEVDPAHEVVHHREAGLAQHHEHAESDEAEVEGHILVDQPAPAHECGQVADGAVEYQQRGKGR